MKVLLTNTGPWGTGSAVVAEAVLQELRRLGHAAVLWFPDAQFKTQDKKFYYSKPHRYFIWRFPVKRHGRVLHTFPLMIPDPHPRNVPRAWTFRDLSDELLEFYFSEAEGQLKKAIDRFRPDIIECQHIWTGAYLARKMGWPYVAVAHHSDQMGFRYDPGMQAYAKLAAAGASWIFAISDFVKREVLELYPGVHEKQVVVLENGYNQQIFCPRDCSRESAFRSLGIDVPGRIPIVTFAGKLSRTKGIDILLRANRLIQRERTVLLLLAGAGRIEDEFTFEERADFYWENVQFLGPVQQRVLAKVHNLASLSVMPSRSEGFGIAALEAMGCGTPVVATRSGGPESFVVGKTVEPGNVEDLAAAVLELLDLKPRVAHCVRRSAYEKARTYSWREIVPRRLNYLRETLRLR